MEKTGTINGVKYSYNDDRKSTDVMWDLLHGAEAIAINELAHYWGEHQVHSYDNKLEVPIQPDGRPFKLGLLYGREFAFHNIVFDEENNRLYFEGRFDDDVKDTVIYEEDLEPVHGILWLADYIINGVY